MQDNDAHVIDKLLSSKIAQSVHVKLLFIHSSVILNYSLINYQIFLISLKCSILYHLLFFNLKISLCRWFYFRLQLLFT